MQATMQRAPETVHRRDENRWLGIGLIALGVGLAVNSVLGPVVLDLVRYPFSETVFNQTIGLEAFSLVVVAPLSVAAGWLVLRGHPAGPVLAFGPAAYTAYMFVQYVVGPEYAYYPRILPLHLGLFILSAALAIGAWSASRDEALPPSSSRTDRRRSFILFGLAAFGVSRYVPMVFDTVAENALTAEFAADVSMYWTILFLDLGVVFPATIAAGVALFVGSKWGRQALYTFIGWWALVPPSVAAMAIAMLARDDPHASAGQAAMFVVVAVLFALFAIRLYRPLFVGPTSGLALGKEE